MAKMVLKTRPDYMTLYQKGLRTSRRWEMLTAWSVERTGSGSVVIWIVLPTMFETTNISIPSYWVVSQSLGRIVLHLQRTCHLRRL